MSAKKDRFAEQFPDVFFLEKDDIAGIRRYLHEKGWLKNQEQLVHVGVAGEGNMNLVLKVETSQKEFILKQARPWVEKYPAIDAPIERIHAEATYYLWHKKIAPLQSYVPNILEYDPENFILFLEYLGANTDATYLYEQNVPLDQNELENLIGYLKRLHHADFEHTSDSFPDNSKLLQLNHQHIFVYPYEYDNGLDLDTIHPGLQELAEPYIRDNALKKRVHQLGNLYLNGGPCLLHGDYYPGSWIKTDQGFKIIDPEFAHFGQPEFDWGVFAAHMYLAGQPEETIQTIRQSFSKYKHFDVELAVSYIGIEIIRRLIGLAQLPTNFTLKQKSELLKQSCEMVITPSKQI